MTGEIPFNESGRRSIEDLPERYEAAVRLALGMTPEEFRDSYSSDGPLEGTLGFLAEFYPDHARAVCNAMVSSPNEEHRMRLIDGIPSLVGRDREYAVPLWDRLIGDPSRKVRRYAYETLAELWDDFASAYERDELLVYEDGITWRDASDLLRTYAEAEAEGICYKLGAVVLDGVVVVTPTEPGPQASGTDPTVT